MIFRSADNNWDTIKIIKNPAQISVQLLAQRFVAKEWAAIFSREYRMDENLCRRLRHVFEDGTVVGLIQLLSGLNFIGRLYPG